MDETYLCQRFFTVIFGIDGKFFVVLAFLNKLQTFLELDFRRSVYASELTKIFPTKHFQSCFSESENSMFNLYKIENIAMGWNYLEILQKLSPLIRAINDPNLNFSLFVKATVRWIGANPSSILSNYFYARIALHMKVNEKRYKKPYWNSFLAYGNYSN